MEDYKKSAINKFCVERGLSPTLASSDSHPYRLILINKTPIYAKIANTPELVATGLMGVKNLRNREGCLLDFNRETNATLWMKNCHINLQTAMIDDNGIIANIANMYYEDPYYVHHSSRPIRYALEMSENFFTNHGIKTGDFVRLL